MENEVENNVSNPINQNSAVENEKKGFSIASMILGIISIALCCIWFISIPCAILAIIFSAIGKRQGGKGMATTGMVLGIIGLSLYILLFSLGFATALGLAGVAEGLEGFEEFDSLIK